MGLGYAFTWLSGPNVGQWNVNVIANAMPQKLASAIGALDEELVGAAYEPIAYIGSQVVNGTNHAVIAKQTILSGKDQNNIVLLKFNEKGMDCSLYAIEPLVQEGPAFGGWKLDVKVGDEMPKEAIESFNQVTEGWVGAKLTPEVLLGTKVTKGVDYLFLATVKPVYPEAKASVKLIMVNSLSKTIEFVDVL